MNNLFKKSLSMAAISALLLMSSCSTLPEAQSEASKDNNQHSRWANPMDNNRFERIQGR